MNLKQHFKNIFSVSFLPSTHLSDNIKQASNSGEIACASNGLYHTDESGAAGTLFNEPLHLGQHRSSVPLYPYTNSTRKVRLAIIIPFIPATAQF